MKAERAARRQRHLLVDPPPERRAEARIQFQVIGVPVAAGRAAPLPGLRRGRHGQDVVGSRRTTTVERRSSTTRSRRSGRATGRGARPTSASSATSRTAATTTSGCARSTAWARASTATCRSQARADTEPGRVQNIRMKSQGDGTITIALGQADDRWTSDPRLHDHLDRWPGRRAGRPAELHRVGAQQQREVRLHDQGRRTRRASPRRASSAEFQPLGTPPAPPAPTVTDLEAGANQTNMRIAWQAVLPEGQGPTRLHRLLLQRRQLGLRAGVPEDRLPHLHPPGRALRRADLHLPVVAANQPGNRSQPSAAGRRSRPSAARRSGGPSAPPARAPARRSSSTTPCPTPAAPRARSTSSSAAWSTGPSTSRPGRSRPGSRCRATSSPIRSSSASATRRRRRGARSAGSRTSSPTDVSTGCSTTSVRRPSTARTSPGPSPGPATATRASLVVLDQRRGRADDPPPRRGLLQPDHHRLDGRLRPEHQARGLAARQRSRRSRRVLQEQRRPRAACPTPGSACAGPEPRR